MRLFSLEVIRDDCVRSLLFSLLRMNMASW